MKRLHALAVALFVFSAPLDMWVIPGVGPVSSVFAALLVGIGTVSVAARARIVPAGPVFAFTAAFVFWSAATILWSRDTDGSLRRVSTLVQLVLVLWFIVQSYDVPGAVERLSKAYLLGCSVLAVATIIEFMSGQTIVEAEQRFGARGYDPNDLGVTLAMGLPMAWFNAVLRGRMRAAYLYMPLSAVAILLTASRGAFLTFGVALLIIPLSLSRLGLLQKVFVGCVAIIACVSVSAWVPESSWERLLTIKQQISSGTIGQRTYIWNAGREMVLDSPVLGVGSGAFALEAQRLTGTAIVAHNTPLSVLAEAGIIGLALWCAMFVAAGWGVRRSRGDIRLMIGAVFAAWSMGVMSLTWEYRKPTWVLIALSIAATKEVLRASSPQMPSLGRAA